MSRLRRLLFFRTKITVNLIVNYRQFFQYQRKIDGNYLLTALKIDGNFCLIDEN